MALKAHPCLFIYLPSVSTIGPFLQSTTTLIALWFLTVTMHSYYLNFGPFKQMQTIGGGGVQVSEMKKKIAGKNCPQGLPEKMRTGKLKIVGE